VTLYNWLLFYIGPILGSFLVIIAALAAGVVLLLRRTVRLERQYRSLTAGTDGGNLEEVLHSHVAELRQAVTCVQETEMLARNLERASRSHVQRIGFLRFNPFRETGGDQSFALTLADQDGNGVVLSSLHSRDVTRVYGKSLVAWESVYPLTSEEQQAIEKAKGNGNSRS
jgi:hypothetical protein